MKTFRLATAFSLALVLALPTLAGRPTFYLPGTVYAAPGLECNIYYKNIMCSVVPQNFAYQAQSRVGSGKTNRWHWTPTMQDVGETNVLVINAWNDDGIVASLTTKVVVAAAPKDPKKKVSLAIFADSLTNSGYPKIIYRDLMDAGCTNFISVGSRRPWKTEKEGWVPHEGIPGYTCSQFLLHLGVTEEELAKAVGTPEYELYRKLGKPKKISKEDGDYDRQWVRSPLIKEDKDGRPVLDKDGKPVVDVRQWIDRHAAGRPPDVVIVQLGVNDVIWLKGEIESLRQQIRGSVMPWYGTFLKTLRKEMPMARFAFTTQPIGSDQDGFGENYGSDWNEVQHRKIMFALNMEIERFVANLKDPRVELLPVAQTIDPFYGFHFWNCPVSAREKTSRPRATNAVHVSGSGGAQMADVMAAWILARWNEL